MRSARLLTPSRAIGAALGAFTGGIWNLIWPGGSLAAYAMICGAALLAVTQRAALTAIVLVSEFTHATQNLLAPMVIAVALTMLTRAAVRKLDKQTEDLTVLKKRCLSTRMELWNPTTAVSTTIVVGPSGPS